LDKIYLNMKKDNNMIDYGSDWIYYNYRYYHVCHYHKHFVILTIV
jgi:hypothetical protein